MLCHNTYTSHRTRHDMPIHLSDLPSAHLVGENSTMHELLRQHDDLGEVCAALNAAYRRGEPLVSDPIYDQVFIPGLRQQQPDHPFLHAVEPEGVRPDRPLVQHAAPMLSTLKAYSETEIQGYVRRVERAAMSLGVTPRFSLTAKLDGVAANDTGEVIATRGDGLQGSDISHI